MAAEHKQKLEQQLWKIADTLRGKMDADEFRDYILGGATKRLTRYRKGVVSTLYICFRIKVNNSQEFYAQYFDSGFINKELRKNAQEGARNHGLLNIVTRN